MRRSSRGSDSAAPRGSLRERIGNWFAAAQLAYIVLYGLALLVLGAIWVVQQLFGHS